MSWIVTLARPPAKMIVDGWTADAPGPQAAMIRRRIDALFSDGG